MAGDHWSPGADIVNVTLPFCVTKDKRLRRAQRKTGAPPTRWNARTGELTPPGKMSQARENGGFQF